MAPPVLSKLLSGVVRQQVGPWEFLRARRCKSLQDKESVSLVRRKRENSAAWGPPVRMPAYVDRSAAAHGGASVNLRSPEEMRSTRRNTKTTHLYKLGCCDYAVMHDDLLDLVRQREIEE